MQDKALQSSSARAEHTLENALQTLQRWEGREIASIWQELRPKEPFRSSPVDKGGVGQIVERLLGLLPDNGLLDFADGELKTAGVLVVDGLFVPKEEMAVTMINSQIDNIVVKGNFGSSSLLKKIRNFIYQPIITNDGDRGSWQIGAPIHIVIKSGTKPYEIIENDFHMISKELRSRIEDRSEIHGVTGKYLQTKTKGSKRKDGTYPPIYSPHYKREVASKSYAFYLTKNFLRKAIADEL